MEHAQVKRSFSRNLEGKLADCVGSNAACEAKGRATVGMLTLDRPA